MAVKSTSAPNRLGTRRQPAVSREAILKAALAEFGEHGLSGARMDAIAETAGVNKALLYYYFRDKDALYGAVLDDFFQRMHVRIMQVFDSTASPGERLLQYVRAHFDSIAASPYYARLFQREMMSAGRLGSPHLSRIVERYIQPISQRVMDVLREGSKSREFRPVDVVQFAPSMVATIVYYFVIAPVVRKLRNTDPFSAKAIQDRRAAVLDLVAAALFADRESGVRMAASIAVAASNIELPSQTGALQRHRVSPQRDK
jgi:TetR/AcrR family transcriptional regulator